MRTANAGEESDRIAQGSRGPRVSFGIYLVGYMILNDGCKMSAMSKARKAVAVKGAGVDPYVAELLGKITVGKQHLSFRKGEKIFSQGEPADSIYFIQSG
jgi:hypothetical protein